VKVRGFLVNPARCISQPTQHLHSTLCHAVSSTFPSADQRSEMALFRLLRLQPCESLPGTLRSLGHWPA
jgi:hypothetical protein